MSFCLQRWRSSLFFGFYLMIIKPTIKANKTMCCKWAGAKSMTEKITEGHGEGAVPKNAGAWKIFGSCGG